MLDWLFPKKKKEEEPQPYITPMPIYTQPAQKDVEMIKYMTKNESIPDDVRRRWFGFDEQFLAFLNLSDKDVEEIKINYKIERLRRINNMPKVQIFHPFLKQAFEDYQYMNVVTAAAEKSRHAEFLRRMTETVSINEIRNSQVKPPKEEGKPGVVASLLGAK